MADPGDLTIESFSGRVGEPFRLMAANGAELPLELAEAERLGDPPSPELRAPFSLIFRGPAEPIAAQGVYGVDHADLGRTDLFLVPLAPDAAGARYQAVFN